MNLLTLTTCHGKFRALLFATAALLSTANAALAADFTFGDVNISIDTTISAGISTRVSNRDCSHVAKGDGGCPSGVKAGGLNSDDGNLNFDRWDLTGATLKSVSDIEIKWQDSGIFLRPRLFYDAVYAENDLRWKDLNHDARQRLDYGVDILDAFVFSNFDVVGLPASVRVGKQVVNWGESTFQRGGINAYQAIDVSAARRPGAELKDIITPMPMAFASLALNDTLSIEGFWQFGFAETEVDPSGSYFSNSDITGPGSISLNSGGTNDANAIVHIYRSPDDRGSDDNQFGVALRNYFPNVNNGTDTALYAVRYTSKLPYIGAISGSSSFVATCVAIYGHVCSNSTEVGTAYIAGANDITYYYEFPDKINELGASFNTTVAGTALSGEVSFTPNMPLATDFYEQLASIGDGTGATQFLTAGAYTRWSRLGAASPGESTVTHVDLNTWQGQFTTITVFNGSDLLPSAIRADSAAFIFNPGFVYAKDAGLYPLSYSGLNAGLTNYFAAYYITPDYYGNANQSTTYATDWSWGYTAMLTATYENPWNLPISVSPVLQFSHGVQGRSPGPNTAGYAKGTKTATAGVNAKYQSWNASVSYTNYFGAGWYNAMTDRDFAAASVSYSF
ncbi:MAG: DUF1302 domain-containing protein [Parvibaculum sp.]|nr:DUF1302 domain-containing protein [Parvibaculum sp.]